MALSPETLRAMEEVGLVGGSPALERAAVTLARAAKTEPSTVIQGETGTGKELFARRASIGCHPREWAFRRASTVRRSPRRCSRASSSGTSAARSPAPTAQAWSLRRARTAGRCSSTRLARCRSRAGEAASRARGSRGRASGSRARTQVDVRVLAATHRDLSAMVEGRTTSRRRSSRSTTRCAALQARRGGLARAASIRSSSGSRARSPRPRRRRRSRRSSARRCRR